MVATPRSPRLFTVAYDQLLANAGQESGVVTSDANGVIECRLLPRYGTKAEIDAIVLQTAEIAITTDTHEIRVGDNSTSGGLSHSNTSPTCIVLQATGTALQNGAALRLAYTAAAALTPQGSAISSTNRAWVELGPGVYDITGGAANLNLATNVGIIGSGSASTTIVCDSTSRIRHPSSMTSILKRFTVSTAGILFGGNTTAYVLDWDDLNLSVGSGVASTVFSAAIISFSGLVRRVITDGKSLLGGATSLTITARMEECRAGDTSFGSATSAANSGTMSGGLFNCTMFGTTCHLKLGGLMVGCDWKTWIPRIVAGAEIYNSTIRGNDGSGTSIGNNSTSVNAIVTHSRLNSAIGLGVTNLIGTPYNVEDTDIA